MSRKPRNLPKWMLGNRRAAVGSAISNIVAKPAKENNKNKVNIDDGEPPKRRLRSNTEFPKTEQELRASEPKFNIDDLEMVSYTGKIHYLTDFYTIAEALDSLIKKVDAVAGEEMVGVAFDAEWTFSFQTGPEKISLIQACIDEDECFLFQISNLTKLPASLGLFLNHPRVMLHGVNIKNDIRKMERDYPTIKADPIIEKCRDLGVWYNEVFNSRGRWSMERLVLQTLKLRMDKSRQVRMSKWHLQLSENQQLYAAIDVYIAQKIFYHIKEKQKQDSENLQGFFSVYSEELKKEEEIPPKTNDLLDEIRALMQL